jgi:1,5-anhydro-D-fructose reductase (1,5-anhydro-D-mannitol-forming)
VTALRWGIAGFGWVARDHMGPGITAAGGRLAAVADPSPAARAAATARGAQAYADVEDMLATERLDALYVATPNHLHLAPVRSAVEAGVPVLCEKPMAASLADAEAIGAAVTGAGVLYGVAFDQRRHPAHVALRQAIEAGAIGRPAAVRIAYCCWVDPLWRPPGETGADNWRADPRAAGGGAVVDLAPHGLDLVHALLGEEVGRLHMALQRRVHDYPVEDGGVVTGVTASGVLVSLHVAYNCPEALPRRRLEVLGEDGQLTAIDTMGQTAGGELHRTCGRTGAREPVPFDAALSPFAAQAAAFAGAVRGEPHDFDLARDLRLARRFDAAYQEAFACL